MLRASIDEREDDDVETEAGSIPFVTTEDIVEQYGEAFIISLDESGMPVVDAAAS